MKTRYPWALLALVVLLDFFGGAIGFHTVGWNEPVTSSDVMLFSLMIVGILVIEIREAATWIAEQIKERNV